MARAPCVARGPSRNGGVRSVHDGFKTVPVLWMEILVYSLCRMVPVAAMSDLSALVLGRITNERVAGLFSGILLKALF